jgi:hypothetical protein
MAIFLESPVPVICIGVVAEVLLAIILWRTGRGRLLWAMLGVAAFVLLGVLVEWLVVTDREAIKNTLAAGAAALEANNLDRLLDCMSPGSRQPRDDARWVLHRVQVESARFANLEITFGPGGKPPTAKARFMAIVKGRDRQGEIPYQAFVHWVVVDFRPERGRWLATGYDIEDVRPPRP